jgi:hypothetical protein
LCATDLVGYESFWAYPHNGSPGSGTNGGNNGTSSSAPMSRATSTGQGQGLNGVATFARTGYTQCASARALQCPELDNEGRCILTDHGTFVIFNIYVPNSGDRCKRFPFKIRFLEALERAMSRERAKGKKVILAGDFNIAARSCDITRSYRMINIHHLVHRNDHFTVDIDSVGCPRPEHVRGPSASPVDDDIFYPFPLLYNSQFQQYYAPGMDRYLTPAEAADLRDALLFIRCAWPTVERALRTVRNEEELGKYRTVADRPTDGKPVRRSAVYSVYMC